MGSSWWRVNENEAYEGSTGWSMTPLNHDCKLPITSIAFQVGGSSFFEGTLSWVDLKGSQKETDDFRAAHI